MIYLNFILVEHIHIYFYVVFTFNFILLFLLLPGTKNIPVLLITFFSLPFFCIPPFYNTVYQNLKGSFHKNSKKFLVEISKFSLGGRKRRVYTK